MSIKYTDSVDGWGVKKTAGEKDWENRMGAVRVKENRRRRYKQV